MESSAAVVLVLLWLAAAGGGAAPLVSMGAQAFVQGVTAYLDADAVAAEEVQAAPIAPAAPAPVTPPGTGASVRTHRGIPRRTGKQ